jgi:hypothetical protein
MSRDDAPPKGGGAMKPVTYEQLTGLAEEQITRYAAEAAAKCESADAVYLLRGYAVGAFLL